MAVTLRDAGSVLRALGSVMTLRDAGSVLRALCSGYGNRVRSQGGGDNRWCLIAGPSMATTPR